MNEKSKFPVFSQLKSLARDVEKGIQSLELDICDPSAHKKRCHESQNHSVANNIMQKKLDETKAIRDGVRQLSDDFTAQNRKFNQIQSLFSDVMKDYKVRLEHVESHMLKYGYKKPSFAFSCDKQRADDDVPEISEDDKEKDENEIKDDEAESGELSSENCSQAGEDKEKFEIKKPHLKEPNFDDFYRNLSESTRAIFTDQPKEKESVPKPETFAAEGARPKLPGFMSPAPPKVETTPKPCLKYTTPIHGSVSRKDSSCIPRPPSVFAERNPPQSASKRVLFNFEATPLTKSFPSMPESSSHYPPRPPQNFEFKEEFVEKENAHKPPDAPFSFSVEDKPPKPKPSTPKMPKMPSFLLDYD